MKHPNPNKRFFIRQNLFALLFAALFALIITQNLFAVILSDLYRPLGSLMLIGKELFIAFVFVIAIAHTMADWVKNGITLSKSVVLIALLLAYLGIASLLSPSFNLMSLRQLLIIPIFYLFGHFIAKFTTLENIKAYVIPLLVLVCISGYFELFVLHDDTESFWVYAGMPSFIELKGFQAWAYGPGGTLANYYSYDFYSLLGEPVRRMASLLLAEPTQLGQMLVLPVLYSLIAGNLMLLVLFGGALLLTLSKGGFLGVFLGYYFYFLHHKQGRISRFLLTAAALLLIVGTAYLALSGSVSSLFNHSSGLIAGFLGLGQYPFGRGIGGTGNYAVLLARNTGESAEELGIEGSGESYLGTIAGQLGLPGILLYVLLMGIIYRLKVPSQKPFAIALKYSLVATLIGGIGSESAISYVASGFMFALLPFLMQERLEVKQSP